MSTVFPQNRINRTLIKIQRYIIDRYSYEYIYKIMQIFIINER